ncbi:hypothetical protein MKEN_00978500 [Mycena kentingensis (nom. inval.)]|nr:hypothetical protein MKEN_00978500 [Mycena kentingensis (nom. inval.)]
MRLGCVVALFCSVLVSARTELDPQTPKEQLIAFAAAGDGVIALDAAKFALLTVKDRTWSASIEFTARSTKWGCGACAAFAPEWRSVAKAWAKAPKQHMHDHFFATFDFDADGSKGQAIFQQLGMKSAPMVVVYPKDGNAQLAKFDLSDFSQPIYLDTPPTRIPLSRPFDYAFYLTRSGAFLGALALTYTAIRLRILQNRWIWATASLAFSMVMASGYMFARIRGAPWAGRGGQMVAPGAQSMYAGEVRLVAPIYILLGLAFYILATIVPQYPVSRAGQRIVVYSSSLLIFFGYSLLIVLFRIKMRSYPYRIL